MVPAGKENKIHVEAARRAVKIPAELHPGGTKIPEQCKNAKGVPWSGCGF